MIIPPGSLEVNRRSRMRRKLHLRSITPPNWPNWNPIIVVGKRIKNRNKYCLLYKRHSDNIWVNKSFSYNSASCLGNRKSGNNDGDQILSLFRRLLNPAQIVDLAERDPVAALEWCRLLGKIPSIILVAGGDGTVAWLLNTINKLELEVNLFRYGTFRYA